MPESDIAYLLTLNIGITLSVIVAVATGVWAIMREMRTIAEIAERIDVRLRRQYTDISAELQTIRRRLE